MQGEIQNCASLVWSYSGLTCFHISFEFDLLTHFLAPTHPSAPEMFVCLPLACLLTRINNSPISFSGTRMTQDRTVRYQVQMNFRHVRFFFVFFFFVSSFLRLCSRNSETAKHRGRFAVSRRYAVTIPYFQNSKHLAFSYFQLPGKVGWPGPSLACSHTLWGVRVRVRLAVGSLLPHAKYRLLATPVPLTALLACTPSLRPQGSTGCGPPTRHGVVSFSTVMRAPRTGPWGRTGS